jgi:hypothetical protein
MPVSMLSCGAAVGVFAPLSEKNYFATNQLRVPAELHAIDE